MHRGDRAQGGQDDLDGFNALFSLRKPRDARAGLASGAKSVAKGVLAGTVGLFAAPALGAQQEGFKGFAKGAAAGIAGAVILPVTGVAVGVTQMVRGAVNAPQAARETARGKVWDERMREWVEEPTLALAVDDGATVRLRDARNGGAAAAPDDYYALLGVPPTASAEEIKHAYYVAARRLHPDKNPDDPEANNRFQAVSQAYQVLGNEQLRQRYDAHGSEGIDVNFVDGAEFFGALFGSDRFEHLVGELMLAAAARAGSDLTPELLKRVQGEREARLEVLLGALLRRWVEGDEDGFRKSMAAEAAELVTASFGEVMLHAIGRVYEVQAAIHLGGLLDGSVAALRAKGRSIKTQFKAVGLALKVYQTQQQISVLEREATAAQEQAAQARLQQEQGEEAAPRLGGIEHAAGPGGGQAGGVVLTPDQLAATAAAAAAQRARLEEDALPLMLEAMWMANAIDIETTLRHVCKRLLNDPAASKEQRRARAQGLLVMGQTFRAARAPAPAKSSGPAAARQQMEEAMAHVVERRMQGDDEAAGG